MLEEIGEHARLIDDHVRELREPLFGVADSPSPLDLGAIVGIRLPETDLVHPVRLSHQSVGQAEGLEDLNGATGNAVGLAYLERTTSLVDQRGSNLGNVGQLRCKQETCGATANNQHVNLGGETVVGGGGVRMRLMQERVSRLISIEVKLHRLLISRSPDAASTRTGLDLRHQYTYYPYTDDSR